ncbi:MAG: transrane transporter [Acidimicrobiales bacterium]|nr:transrane transporter [Acidimicrobiales bacterium]
MTARRDQWLALAVACAGVAIVALDTTILNVSIPTIIRDFHTSLPSLQWVITGYSLTFAALLIIGGRLGDMFGLRRIFIVGASLFGLGSLIAGLSQNVAQLVLGEAVIEGIGASLMLPCTLATITTTFEGDDRVKAFGLWGAVSGASAALGPVVGGLLTSNASWRWSFGLNVIVVPFAIVGAMRFMEPPVPRAAAGGRSFSGSSPSMVSAKTRHPLDLRGAAMIGTGMFLLVFALSEGATYGWLVPVRNLSIGHVLLWPTSMPLSVAAAAAAISVGTLACFVVHEMSMENRAAGPLVEFSQFMRPAFRVGLGMMLAISIGQLAVSFILPILLQDGRHLSPQINGLWQLPSGVSVIIGSQLGSRLAIRLGPVAVVRLGLAGGSIGFVYIAWVLNDELSFLQLLPGLILCGLGLACCLTQLTNVILAEVDREKSGAASGISNTSKQIGQAIGIALISALLTSRFAAAATSAIHADDGLSVQAQSEALQAVRTVGVASGVPPDVTSREATRLGRLYVDALVSGSRAALLFGGAVLIIGLLISARLPTVRPTPDRSRRRRSAQLRADHLA